MNIITDVKIKKSNTTSQKNNQPKKFNPNEGIVYVPFERELVKFVDAIIEQRIKLGRPTQITKNSHWQLVELILRGWCALYPEYANRFFDHMKRVRNNAKRLGVAREGEAMIQHQVEVPQSLYQMIMTAFPNQKWDKKFVLKFARRFSGFMAAHKL